MNFADRSPLILFLMAVSASGVASLLSDNLLLLAAAITMKVAAFAAIVANNSRRLL
jgi:formate hydrogenlyase subunit 3/multisubunit Na+/H+ antiporter MnhD subunit